MVTRRPRRLAWILVVVFSAMAGISGSVFAWLGSLQRDAPLWAEPPHDLRDGSAPLPRLVRVDAGTHVGDEPPPGWAHIVLRTSVFIESGDLKQMPRPAFTTATRLRTAMLVATVLTPSGYILDRVGVGLTLAHRGLDLIVSPATASELGVSMSLVDRFVLKRGDSAVANGRIPARTPTFALYDGSIEMATPPDFTHRTTWLRHALLLDPRSGAMRAVLWSVPEAIEARVNAPTLVEIPLNTRFECGVHVAAEKIGNIPYNWRFGFTSTPPGTPVSLDAPSLELANCDQFTPEQAAELEMALRRALASRDSRTTHYAVR